MSCLRTAPTIAEPIIIGADRLFEFQIDDDTTPPTPFNLSGATLLFEVYRLTADLVVRGSALINKTVGADLIIVNAGAGEIQAWITAVDGIALASPQSYDALLRLRITGSDGKITWPIRHRIKVCPF